MVKVDFWGDTLKILYPTKTRVDLDALNYIALQAKEYFLCIKYTMENGKHCFNYNISSKDIIKNQTMKLEFDEFIQLMNNYCNAVEKLEENGFPFGNIKFDVNFILKVNNRFQFVYVPVILKKSFSLRKGFKELLSYVNTDDARMIQFVKELKLRKTDEMVLEYCKFFYSKYLKQKTELGSGTTSLSHPEEGTTILSQIGEETTILSQAESETTVLSYSEEGTTVLSQSEGETTVLSQTESETTVLSQSEGETTVLSETAVANGSWDYGRTTQIIQDEFSESETTLFTAPPNNAVLQNQSAENIKIGDSVLSIINSLTGESVVVNKNIFTIGKDIQNMDYAINNNSVSKNHATITCEQNSYFIMDNKSTNGTAIEGVMLQPYEKAELYDGSIISLGNVGLQIKIERG